MTPWMREPVRKRYPNREKWLEGRHGGIGASECAAVLGISPFQSNVDVWAEKTGRVTAKDLSGNEAVAYGVRMESAMRCMFAAEHPEIALEYHQYDILFQSDLPWITATLDGELTETATGFDFCILYAKLVSRDGDSSLRAYPFNREDAAEDMAYIVERETEFWKNNVIADKRPALILPSL